MRKATKKPVKYIVEVGITMESKSTKNALRQAVESTLTVGLSNRDWVNVLGAGVVTLKVRKIDVD